MRVLLAGVMVWMMALAAHAAPWDRQPWEKQFHTVWESLWYQAGSPVSVARWGGDIPVRIHGRDAQMHRTRILDALRTVAGHAGLRIVDVSAEYDAPPRDGLDVEIVGDRELENNQPCYVRYLRIDDNLIRQAELKMRSSLVYHCALHEAMHVMGIVGHPSGDTVLSYFHQRADRLTALDEVLLRAWYSPAMRAGMTPLHALVVLTDEIVRRLHANSEAARTGRQQFLQAVLADMEAFADNRSEVPSVIKRSGKATADAMRRAQTLMRFNLGVVYLDGAIVAIDKPTGASWVNRAARDGHVGAQYVMGVLHERGEGVTESAPEAYAWYGLAAAWKVGPAIEAQRRVASALNEAQVAEAQQRMQSLQQVLHPPN